MNSTGKSLFLLQDPFMMGFLRIQSQFQEIEAQIRNVPDLIVNRKDRKVHGAVLHRNSF